MKTETEINNTSGTINMKEKNMALGRISSKELDLDDTGSPTIGNFLKNHREKKGLTQSDVAQKLGYGSPQFISNVERGISNIPVKALKIIIDLYELQADTIVDMIIQDKRTKLRTQLGLKN